MESAMLILHSGRPYGTDSSRQRQDHARRPSCYQRSKASIQELASRYDLNPKTVMKWRKRAFLYCSYGAEGASLNGTQLCLRNATARASSRRSLGQRCSLTSTHSFTNAFGTVIPYVKIHTILTDNGIQFCDLPKNRSGPTVRWQTHMFDLLCQAQQPL
jgi:hypothetical protein